MLRQLHAERDEMSVLRARCDELLEASLKHTHVWKESDEALRLRTLMLAEYSSSRRESQRLSGAPEHGVLDALGANARTWRSRSLDGGKTWRAGSGLLARPLILKSRQFRLVELPAWSRRVCLVLVPPLGAPAGLAVGQPVFEVGARDAF